MPASHVAVRLERAVHTACNPAVGELVLQLLRPLPLVAMTESSTRTFTHLLGPLSCGRPTEAGLEMDPPGAAGSEPSASGNVSETWLTTCET